ncbi:uncharacterized protein LOC102498050 [Tupaia chinensis]|uniref:uncharacterized protein LOC102498050 n=1 Tax=Tupaia chinensis TaxID=246437 RepID=UPI000FFB8415|nr:uncharacterized protein LOC102498050 [Tupaia chinensis]
MSGVQGRAVNTTLPGEGVRLEPEEPSWQPGLALPPLGSAPGTSSRERTGGSAPRSRGKDRGRLSSHEPASAVRQPASGCLRVPRVPSQACSPLCHGRSRRQRQARGQRQPGRGQQQVPGGDSRRVGVLPPGPARRCTAHSGLCRCGLSIRVRFASFRDPRTQHCLCKMESEPTVVWHLPGTPERQNAQKMVLHSFLWVMEAECKARNHASIL